MAKSGGVFKHGQVVSIDTDGKLNPTNIANTGEVVHGVVFDPNDTLSPTALTADTEIEFVYHGYLRAGSIEYSATASEGTRATLEPHLRRIGIYFLENSEV